MRQRGIAWACLIWQGKSRKADFKWHWDKFPFSERRLFIFGAQNLHFVSTQVWAVYLEQYLSIKFAFSEHRILFLSAKLQYFSVEFTFSEHSGGSHLSRSISEQILLFLKTNAMPAYTYTKLIQ